MHKQNLDKWIARGKADGYRYLLICFDTFDAIRGDQDGGYYPVHLSTLDEVVTEVTKRQTGEWHSTDARDFCEFVVDLCADEVKLELPVKVVERARAEKS